MSMRSALVVSLFLTGCRGVIPDDNIFVDDDGDGYASIFAVGGDDCDDLDAAVNPAAAEVCDDVDNNCDGAVDEGVTTTWYSDLDGDGFGDVDAPVEACTQPTDAVADSSDCDDVDAVTYPGAAERCDSIDNDCDGQIDEDVVTTWHRDLDGDGHGDPAKAVESCDPGAGWVATASDCDDSNSQVSPDAREVCNLLDDDCDGAVDVDAVDAATWYSDADADGYGDDTTSLAACDAPAGTVERADDCDDADAAVNPSATEVCGGLDDDCDGLVDDADPSLVGALEWYTDADGDGWGDDDGVSQACDPPTGSVEASGDCDDSDAAVHPDAAEGCNDLDDDCDGLVDGDDPDAIGDTTWYVDADDDGYGNSRYSMSDCAQPSGWVADGTDCDDGEALSYPGNDEVCDEIDNDCDGDVDEDDAIDASTWYADVDGDGYGDPATGELTCDSDGVADNSDCDDSEAAAYPGAAELYDGLDNDCDGSTDEDLWIGDGSDGALTVTGATNLNSDASGGRTAADAVAYSVSAISGDTLTVGRRVSGLAAGDEVLVINLQGSDSAFAAVGAYEFASVESVSGSTITLSAAVSGTYGEKSNADLSDQVVMVQRVPHYTDVSVAAGATLTVDAWDGSTGGVLAFRASGEVHVADGGLIDVAGLGFSGGETGSDWNYDAFQGESYAGAGVGDEYGGPYNEAIYGYLANEGGGGANVTGAGGGYGSGGGDAGAWYPGVYTAPSGGDTYGDADLDSMFLGSGGGGVWNGGTDATGEDPGPGGAGGGILYIGAATLTVDGEAGISAAGAKTDHWAYGSWTYGAGGGAGGSIWLLADALDLATGAVDGGGGAGRTAAVEREGGAGGDGRIRADATTVGGAALGSSTANAALDAACTPDAGSSQAPG